MNGFITWRNINTKFQLVHLGKLAENQLARNQNLLVMDERTSVKIFTVIFIPLNEGDRNQFYVGLNQDVCICTGLHIIPLDTLS